MKGKGQKLQVEIIDINALKPYENNAKLHPQEQIDQIANSIKEFGNNDPIAVDENNVIIEGHGRLLALQQLGYEEVEIIRLSHLTEEQRKAYTLVHNKLTMNSGFDMDLLIEELKEIENIDMDSLGFDDIQIDVIPDLTEDIDDFDDYMDDHEKRYEVEVGDVYQLGNHRLMCGSSTEPKHMAKLLGDEKVDLINTDPPYNVNYSAKVDADVDGRTAYKNDKRANDQILNDHMSADNFNKFLDDVFKTAFPHVKEGGAIYVWHSEAERESFTRSFCEAGFKLSQTLIWVKQSLNLTRQDYQWIHEPCLYGWKLGAAHYFINDFTLTSVIDVKPKVSAMSTDELKQHIHDLWEHIDNGSSIIRENKPQASDLHPTMKPIKLIGRQIYNSSRAGEIVLDMFGGSGSTLIACEQSGRHARLMELDPNYCDVILTRWEDFTGEKVVKIK